MIKLWFKTSAYYPSVCPIVVSGLVMFPSTVNIGFNDKSNITTAFSCPEVYKAYVKLLRFNDKSCITTLFACPNVCP